MTAISPTTSRKDALLDTALALFYRYGFHATGIDRILAESGVAKMTLYKHFKSKDELIVAALRRRHEQDLEELIQTIERLGRTPRERLLALFDALGAWFSDPGFRGCLFLNASAEFTGANEVIRAAAIEHKQQFCGYIRGLAAEAGAPRPDDLARQLFLLGEGAVVTAQLTGRTDPAQQARAAAEVLIDAALALAGAPRPVTPPPARDTECMDMT